MPKSYEGYTLKQDFWTPQQEAAFLKSLHQKHFAYFMDPRTGKSKPNVDKACYHFERQSNPLGITGVLVIAWPNGVHRGWITDAFPENVPSRINWAGFTWRASQANLASKKAKSNKKRPPEGYIKEFLTVCRHPGLAVFAVNAEALRLPTTKKAIDFFLRSRKKVMCIGDETCFMSEPDSIRARVMLSISKRPEIVVKTILDGTPVDGNPFGYFAPVRFLDPNILGFTSYQLFKAHYAEFKQGGDRAFWGEVNETKKRLVKAEVELHKTTLVIQGIHEILAEGQARNAVDKKRIEETAQAQARKNKAGRFWTEIAKDKEGWPQFKNLDELHAKLDPISYRATFAQCFKTPRKIYQKHYFQLSDEQRRVYEELREEYRAVLRDGTEINANHHLTRMLRAQQIASNYFPEQKVISLHEPCEGMGCEACNDSGVVEGLVEASIIDPNNHPRLDALKQELSNGKPTIVWVRFRQDAVDCYNLCKDVGLAVCEYRANKEEAKDGFQSGKYQVIIGQWQSMARGIPLWRAWGHVMYSNGFSRRDRLQGEERAEIAHRTLGTSIVDIVAENTVDDLAIMPALKMNVAISDMIMKDPERIWI